MYLKRPAGAKKPCSIPLTKRPMPAKIKVKRAPFMDGLSVVLGKKFQRPVMKRRAYGKQQDEALKRSSLGMKRRMNGMANILRRSGKGLFYKAPERAKLHADGDSDTEGSSDEDEKEEDRPFEPLCVWNSPHLEDDDGNPYEAKGLPPRPTDITRPDEYGVEETIKVMRPAPKQAYSKQHVYVPPVLAKWLRPHQREGVKFMYECVMGLKDFEGNGCILADDMGLGKTLQSVTLIYTLIKTHITAKATPTAKRVIVVCPCSLVKNWDNEFVKWLGPGAVKTLALAEADRKKVEKDIDTFVRTNMFNVLIASYECIRTHVNRFLKAPTGTSCCDLLVCDEAHRLKNADNQTSRALNSLPVKRRVLLTGTPMQNDLKEFYAMVDFTNPGILGSQEEFSKKMLNPILRGREPDATDSQRRKMQEIQNEMSQTVNDFILRRLNKINAQHLPPKLVQVVCCNLTDIQQNMYQHLVSSKDMQHVLDGKQVNCLGSIQALMKLCNHPSLIVDEEKKASQVQMNRRGKVAVKYSEDDKESAATPGADGVARYLPIEGAGRGGFGPVHPEWSGKMFVLWRLMKEMRKPGNGNDKIVIISNYTQTLDLIGRMCKENSWRFCRLDGSIGMKKRQNMVDEFNDPSSSLCAFLLSSKAGGCGINLIGGNRLVLFDPDWNPAVDKQAAARCWRDGQKKRCFTYRFLSTGTLEEKIFQRQLSKEGLQSVVDDKEQVNALSTKDLRNLFKLRTGTPSDTHDKLRCERCEIIHDNAEMEAARVLPAKLAACRDLLAEMEKQEYASHFAKPLDPTLYGKTKEEYEGIVKQPMDFATIRANLAKESGQPGAYKSVSNFSKDVNRVFANVLKTWDCGEEITTAAQSLQTWWTYKWKDMVPKLMMMKATDDPNECTVAPSVAEDDPLAGCASNERGDDYQEQIGMPDEENMRHWSHHHSTDTVDDPIFRAAMKGNDSVSFVFGLEVTWSLIQQRQQEEEERIAMEALQCIQEDDNEDDDNEDEGDENQKPAAKACNAEGESSDESDDDANDTETDQDMTPTKANEKCNKEVGGDPKGSSSTEATAKTSFDESTESEDSDEEMALVKQQASKSTILVDSSDDDDNDDESTEDEKSPGKRSVEDDASHSATSSDWSCPKCTLQNSNGVRKCNACGHVNNPPRKKRN